MYGKGNATEQKLMQATAELLEQQSPLSLSVQDIARQAGTSSATFYVYFKSVKEVLLAVVQTLQQPFLDQVLPTVATTWPDDLKVPVGQFVAAYSAFWNRHRRILAVRNLEADLGDQAFVDQRIDMSLPVVDALAKRISDRHPRLAPTQAWAQAVVCAAALEEMFSYPPQAYRSDVPVTPDDVIAAEIAVITAVLRSNNRRDSTT